MKAIYRPKHGSPDVLELREVEKPVPADDEARMRVHASSVNPLDWHFMRGSPFFMRLMEGLTMPKRPILGSDVAGVVEAVGKDVTRFEPGDGVWGQSTNGGGLAEYACAREGRLVHKPAGSSFEEVASIPVAGITALQGLVDHGNVQPGQRVLINGASGGVGTFAVQLAKAFGAEVTGVCSARNLDLVRSIGADHVIDYTQGDYTRTGQHYELILDLVGNRSVKDHERILDPEGTCVNIGFTSVGRMLRNAFAARAASSKHGRTFTAFTADVTSKDLESLNALLENGKLEPVIDRRYPLDESAEAMRYLETGRARGKVVIVVKG
jgi:NADPH:quinone reductase-like Zn-dependent oxidoreductase